MPMSLNLEGRIAEFLRQEIEQLTRLEGILEREVETIKQRDATALSENTLEKHDVIGKIETLGRERLNLLHKAGISNKKEDIVAYLSTTPQLDKLRRVVESKLLNCQEKNQVNGILLEKDKQQVQQLLGILLGENVTQDEGLYNAKGNTSSSFVNGRSVKV